MPDGTLQRSYGKVFNQVAAEYDRHRPTYPEQLIDLAGLERGEEVLEVGCGTGQLTRSLLARGLRVTAIEPGAQLAGLAQQRLRGTGELELVNARFEDARLPHEHFRAVFSASAIHWVDPDVGWQRAADALVPGGTLALIQYFGLHEPRSADDQQALLSAMTAIAPEIAASWPHYRDLETTLAGVRERRENISEVWAWLGGYEVAREYAADLFDDAQIAVAPTLMEHTAAELGALLGTMSFWSRLSPEQREAIEHTNRALHEQLGRPIRSSIVACLLTAERHPHTAQPAGRAHRMNHASETPVIDHEHPREHHDRGHAGHGHSHGLLDPSIKRSRAGLRVVAVSLALLAITAIAQAAIYIATGSVALLADLIHNAGDALTAVPLAAAFLLRSERAERGAGIAVVLTILASAITAGVFAIARIVHPLSPTHLLALALAGVIGVIGNALAARVRLSGGRRLDSPALIADGHHARSDAIVSACVIISAGAVAAGAPIADPIIGLAITGLILQITWESWRTVRGHDHHHHD